MIPRTKVNYNFRDLVRATFITEQGTDHKRKLLSLLQNYLGEENILLTPSGRGSLYYLLKAIDKRRVLVPAYTCKAVIEAIVLAGKEVAHIEVEKDGFNMSVVELEKTVDEDSIIVATHQFGIPCEIEKIVKLCQERSAFLIEDAAASFGTRVKGKLTGTFAGAAFFSFDSTKLINVPLKGGFITVKDRILFNRVKHFYATEIRRMPFFHKLQLLGQAVLFVLLENHCLYGLFHWLIFDSRGKFTTDTPSLDLRRNEFYQYELGNWQAYIAAKQIAQIEGIIKTRRWIYCCYLEKLRHCRAIALPPPDTNSEWACIRFPIRVHGDKLAYYKASIKRGIDFAFSFTFIACPNDFTQAKFLADTVLDLPFYLKLSDDEVDQVAAVLQTIDGEIRDESKWRLGDAEEPGVSRRSI